MDSGGPSPAGHVGGECGHAFGGLYELIVQLEAGIHLLAGKPEFVRLAVLEGFAQPGVAFEIERLPGGETELVAAASDEKFAGLGFRSMLDGARGVLAVERGHALRFLFVDGVVVPHGGRSFHRAPSGAAGIFALDAIRARPRPPPRPFMFPEREALIRTPDTLERERKEPPPDVNCAPNLQKWEAVQWATAPGPRIWFLIAPWGNAACAPTRKVR